MSTVNRFKSTPVTSVKTPLKYQNTIRTIIRVLDANPELEQIILNYINLLPKH